MISAGSVGIVTSGSDRAEGLLSALRRAQLIPSNAVPSFIDVAYTPPALDGSPRRRHLFWDEPEEDFDLIACTNAVRFFESPWGAAFIKRLMRNCKPGGLVVIPQCHGPQDSPTLYFSASRVEPLLGKGDANLVPKYLCFRRPEAIGGDVASMLSWSTRHFLDEDIHRYVAIENSDYYSDIRRLAEAESQVDMDPNFESDGQRTSELGARSDVFGDPASEFLRTFTYWIGGLAYKAPTVVEVARLCGLPAGASLVDYGGGAGQLAVESVLDPDCPIGRATAVDLAPGNALVFDRISRDLRPALKDRVRFVAGSFARWLPEEPVEMITCLGALLYLPRADVGRTLTAWWRKLKPGGVLLIHENIRQPDTPPSRDRLRMFDGQEIVAALEPFGTTRFLSPTARQELSPDEAAGKSVFRFVQKHP